MTGISRAPDHCVFTVCFKFARLSFRANKLASVIPMLIIAGYPGFIAKTYAHHPETGYWQGMYEWESQQHLKDYQRSLVFRVMKKRALPDSIKQEQKPDYHLDRLLSQ